MDVTSLKLPAAGLPAGLEEPAGAAANQTGEASPPVAPEVAPGFAADTSAVAAPEVAEIAAPLDLEGIDLPHQEEDGGAPVAPSHPTSDCPTESPPPPPSSHEPPPSDAPSPSPSVAPSPAPGPSASGEPTPVSPSSPASPGSPSEVPKEAIIIGNKRRARTVRSFLRTMQKRGIQLPFDPASLPKELLDTKLKPGQSLALGTDGKPLGFLNTVDVMANQSLGVSNHLQRKVDVKDALPRYETLGEGGSITIAGQSVSVVKTYLKSPIMLDLTGDGQLGTTGASTAKNRVDNKLGKTVQFDVDGDGKLDTTEWMSGNGDGMLVDDRDGGATRAAQGDGRIDGTRLFGDQGGKFAHGYEKLAQHDADGDGKLTGQELEGLKTWVDDGDAVVEAGELKTLAELGVTELGTGMTLEKNARGEDLMRSRMVRNGQEQVTEDVWFNTKAP